MKSLLNIAIITLLSVYPTIISAFSPIRIPNNQYARLHVKVSMVRGKPARSKEDDLELTRAIIMKHIESTDMPAVDGAEDDDDEASSEGGGDKPLRKREKVKNKIKEFGAKVKSKRKRMGSK